MFIDRAQLEGIAVLLENMMSYLGYTADRQEEELEIFGYQLGIQNRASGQRIKLEHV